MGKFDLLDFFNLIQAKAQNQKAEKLRDVQGLSRLRMMSFGALSIAVAYFVRENRNAFYPMLVFVSLECITILFMAKCETEDWVCLCGISVLEPFAALLLFSWGILTFRQMSTLIVSGLAAVLFYLKYRKDVSNRVRMVLAIYDICKGKKKVGDDKKAEDL